MATGYNTVYLSLILSFQSSLRLKDEIRQQVEASEDSVLFCDLGRLSELGEKRFSYVGQSRDTTDNDVLIL